MLVPCCVPGCVQGLRGGAFVKECDDFHRKAGEIHEDALLVLEALKFLLADLQGVQEEVV